MGFFLTRQEINQDVFDSISDLATAHGYASFEHIQGGSLRKKTEEVWTSFGYGVLDYGEIKTFRGFGALIQFPKFERICHPVLKQHGLMGGKTEEFRPSFDPPHKPFKNSLRENLQVTKRSELDEVKLGFRRFMIEDALPYFEVWGHLEKLYDLAKSHETREPLSDLLGPLWPFKKATVLRIFDDPQYEDFIDKFCAKRKEILKAYPDEKVAEQYYKASNTLRERLSKPL